MLLIKPTITVTDFPSKRAYKRAMQAAHTAMGILWHDKLLPKHFKRDAPAKYKHQARTPKYLLKKKRMFNRRATVGGQTIKGGGVTDNVFTGQMQSMLERAGTVRAFPSRVTVKMTGPRYVTMRVYKGNQPNKLLEISATTADERDQMAQAADKELQKHLNKTGETKVSA